MPRITKTNLLLTVASAALFAISAPKTASAQRAGGGADAAAAQAREQAIAQDRALEEAAQRAAQQAQEEAAARRGARAQPARGRRAGGAFGGAAGGMDAETMQMLMGEQSPTAAGTSSGAFRGDRGTMSVADIPVSKEPKEVISLNLWVITIEMPKAKTADDMVASLVQRVNELPPIVERDDVRVLLGKLSVAGVLRRSREFQLFATDGQRAHTQIGSSQPYITSTTIVNRGRSNSYNYRDSGTIIQALPTILTNGDIQINLMYQASEVQKTSPPVIITEMADGGDPLVADQIVTQSVNTNVQLKRGSAAIVQRDVQSDPTNEAACVRAQLVIVAASVLPPAK